MDAWKSGYSDDFSAGPQTLRRLFEQQNYGDVYSALKLILDKAPKFLQEYYSLVPIYDDGLDFVDFAYDIITPHKRKIPGERYMRWDICLITLKLEMLDKLGRWEEYRDYFNKIYSLHPDYQGRYAKTAVHLTYARAHPYMISADGDYYNVHFLYLLLPRYEAINRYLKARRKGVIKRRPPDTDSLTMSRNYNLLAERLGMLLKLDGSIMRLYQ